MSVPPLSDQVCRERIRTAFPDAFDVKQHLSCLNGEMLVYLMTYHISPSSSYTQTRFVGFFEDHMMVGDLV